jgi:hypothetical protein
MATLMTTSPAATRFATYPGDVTHIVGEVKGPNLLGEWLTAVTADYDAATDKTRVGFTFQTVAVPA